MNITKKILAKNLHFLYPDIAEYKILNIVNSVFVEIANELNNKNTVSICNFGSFKIKKQQETKRRHPKTKKIILIPSQERLKFTPSNNLNLVMERNGALLK